MRMVAVAVAVTVVPPTPSADRVPVSDWWTRRRRRVAVSHPAAGSASVIRPVMTAVVPNWATVYRMATALAAAGEG